VSKLQAELDSLRRMANYHGTTTCRRVGVPDKITRSAVTGLPKAVKHCLPKKDEKKIVGYVLRCGNCGVEWVSGQLSMMGHECGGAEVMADHRKVYIKHGNAMVSCSGCGGDVPYVRDYGTGKVVYYAHSVATINGIAPCKASKRSVFL
jgi:hypothetical protein